MPYLPRLKRALHTRSALAPIAKRPRERHLTAYMTSPRSAPRRARPSGRGKRAHPRPPQETPRAPAAVQEGLEEHDFIPQLSHQEIRSIIFGIMLAMFLGALDQTIVATALPTIGSHFGDLGDLSWVVTAYLITGTAVTPLYGKLSDIHGRRMMLLTAIVLFVLGSVACALAPSMTALIIARGLQGLGGGGLMALSQTIIADIVSPRERGRYQGYIAAVFATSSVGGPVLGGFLTEHLDWSLIFWINLPMGLAALGMTSNVLKRVPFHPRKHKLDLIGAALMVTAAVAMLLALSWGGRKFDWISAPIGALLLGSAVLWGLFGWRLMTAQEPFLPLTVLGNPVVRCAALAGACAMATLVGMTIFVPLYFEVVLASFRRPVRPGADPADGLDGDAVDLHRAGDDARGALQAHAVRRRDDFHFVSGRACRLAGLAADLGRADAAGGDRRRARQPVPDLDRVHAERGGAEPDGYRHGNRQLLPRAVFVAGGGGPRRHRAGRLGRRHRRRGGDAGARVLAAYAGDRVPFRVPGLRAGARLRHDVPAGDGGARAARALDPFAAGRRPDRAGDADPGIGRFAVPAKP